MRIIFRLQNFLVPTAEAMKRNLKVVVTCPITGILIWKKGRWGTMVHGGKIE
jgi:hypothetical protein